MQSNNLELIGKINWKDMKEHSNCTVVKFLVARKIKGDEWASFPITMFNEEGRRAYKMLEKGDSAHFEGKLQMATYKIGDKDVEKPDIIAFTVDKVQYNTEKRIYEILDTTRETVEDEEDIPWN